MVQLTLKKTTLNIIRQHCSCKLIDNVFNDFGIEKIVIDETNAIEDKWDINEYIFNNTLPLVEKSKVIVAFDRALGTLIFNNEELPIEAICAILCRNNMPIMNDVLTAWRHIEMNNMCPFFEYGTFEIPKLMLHYVVKQTLNNTFIIEKWIKGEYVPLKGEVYFDEITANERAEELNDLYEEDE